MDEHDETVLRETHLAILQDLDVRDVAPALYQNHMINKEQYETLFKSPLSRPALCEHFLFMITTTGSTCTFDGLLSAFRHNNVYSFLADKLEACREQKNITTVPKINAFSAPRRKAARIAHGLKRLSHDGQTERFNHVTQCIHERYRRYNSDLAWHVNKKMELADMEFAALEAECVERRVKYDASLPGSDVFRKMREVLPFTSNPRIASMTYLARSGSAVGMRDGISAGLANLDFAKHHAEHVTPCMDTGMVYYIEVNLLMQQYEASPSDEMKVKVLNTANLAISQFGDETEEIRIDFQRMLMLKMVFCHLGIGLFGNRIVKVKSSKSDREAATSCLNFIEKPEVWNGMEKRRKMLCLIAKTELCRQQDSRDRAEMYARESRNIAQQNGWTAELSNIDKLVQELEEQVTANSSYVADDFFESLISEFTYSPVCQESESNCKTNDDVVAMNTLKDNCMMNDAVVAMNTLKDNCMTNDDVVAMNTLKDNCDVVAMNTLKDNCMTNDDVVAMNTLKDNCMTNDDVIAMNTLKDNCMTNDDVVAMNNLKDNCMTNDDVGAMNTLKDNCTTNDDVVAMNTLKDNCLTNDDVVAMNTLKDNCDVVAMNSLKDNCMTNDDVVAMNTLKDNCLTNDDVVAMNTLKDNCLTNDDVVAMNTLKDNCDVVAMNTLKDNCMTNDDVVAMNTLK